MDAVVRATVVNPRIRRMVMKGKKREKGNEEYFGPTGGRGVSEKEKENENE